MNMKSTILLTVAAIGIGVVAAGLYLTYSDAYRGPNTPPTMPTPETLKSFASKKIFFGHQSVGYNILDGLAAMAPDFTAAGVAAPEIREISSADEISEPGVYHARAGRNVDPMSKIAAFEELLVQRGIGAKVDVALLKFCYVDFPESVDPATVVDAYLAAIGRIKKAYPNLVIVHSTCPLTAHTWSLKSRLRVLLKGDPANIRRNAYNHLLISKVGSEVQTFDIATLESTRPDGSREEFSEGGRSHVALFRGYTYDNGHLNADGAKRAAAAFVEAVVK